MDSKFGEKWSECANWLARLDSRTEASSDNIKWQTNTFIWVHFQTKGGERTSNEHHDEEEIIE